MGGKVFKGTSPVDRKAVDSIVNSFNVLLSCMGVKLHVIGSCYNMSDDAVTGDIDSLISEQLVCKYFGVKTGKEARKSLRAFLETLGFETAQSGSAVHVKVIQKRLYHQIDLMLVDYPTELALFHRHRIPEGSLYKGFHKQMALMWLAKENGLCWSAFQGLYTRDKNKKRDRLLTVDADSVAWILISEEAMSHNLESFESIVSALDSITANKMISELNDDPSWSNYHAIH